MKTLIVEDNTAQREHLERLLRERIPQALPLAAVGDGAQALIHARQEQPQLLVMDIQLPGLNGIEIARRVWAERSETRIVFWSQFKDEIYVRRLAQIVPPETVYGYVLKSSPDEKLVQAVRMVLLEEQCWLDREIRGVQARALQSPSALTDAEYEALIDIALGLTDRGIARRRYLSRRGAQNRLHGLYTRLGVEREEEPGSMFSPRSRAVFEGLQRGLLNADVLAEENAALQRWLEENPD
ncbi:MAG: response regulator transcription factor [Armatimonadetes bacterium]|nr:response regulator transcription factor [Armatimonadota bacterium]